MGGIGEMFEYDISANTWNYGLSGPPNNSYNNGKSLVSDNNGTFYLCRGQNQSTCYTYTVGTNTWAALPSNPSTSLGSSGTSIEWYNGSLYALRGASGYEVHRYTPGAGWTASTASPIRFYLGSQLVASESAMFAFGGNGGTQFYKFDGSTWTARATAPEGVSVGSGLIKANANYNHALYAILGNNRGRLFRYDELPNTWTELTPAPVASYYGGVMVYDGADHFYYAPGGEDEKWGKQLYRYSLSSDTWTRLADLPSIVRNGSGMVWYNNALYIYQGYGGDFYKYTLPATNDTFVTSGTWYSPIYDLHSNSAWNSFTASPAPPDGSVQYSIRTSENGNIWGSWSEIGSSTIAVAPKRYAQVKVVLSGDGTSTPSVGNWSIEYTRESTGPTFSDFELTARSQYRTGVLLTSEQSYNYRTPSFSWTAAADADEGLKGYYVYFGDSPTGNPQSEGVFVKEPYYNVANGLTSGTTYYLRIQAVDNQDNLSSIRDDFTYVYGGISPVSVATLTTQADWETTESTQSAVYTASSAWWNRNYLYRQQITVTASSTNLNKQTIIKIDTDSAALETLGKVRADRKDWRVVYWNGTSWKQLDREYLGTTETYFNLQKTILAGQTDNNYYLYYGHTQEKNDPPSQLASVKGGYKWSSGIYSDGGDRVQIPNAINGLTQMTIEGWFRYQSASGVWRWIYGNNSTVQVGMAVLPDNYHYMRYYFRTNTTAYTSGNGTTYLEPGKWYHVAYTYDAANTIIKAYINGRLDFSYTIAGANVLTTTQQTIGSGNNSNMYGYLDEFRISNSVRYTDEFTPPTEPFTADGNTLALYHFDDGTGQVASDASGNNRHGTLGSNGNVETIDPTWTIPVTATLGEEAEKPLLSADADLKLEPLSEGSWAGYQIPDLPHGSRMYYGAASLAENKMYILRGYNSSTFYSYDMENETWTQLANAPVNMYYGSHLVYDGDDALYALRGNSSQGFYKYTISTNTWDATVEQVPLPVGYGGTLVKAKDNEGNDVLYALRGSTGAEMFKYNLQNNFWETVSSSPFTPSTGTGMAWDGTRYIYVTMGASFYFTRYDTQTDSWSTDMAYPPYAIGNGSGDLALYGDYLYTFTNYDYKADGENKHFVWRYSISGNRWETVDVATDFWLSAGAVAYDGARYVYQIQGASTGNTGSVAMVRFDLKTHKYTPETPPLPLDRIYAADGASITHSPYTGTSLAYDGTENIYFIQGGTSWMNRYNTNTLEWSRLGSIPCSYYGGMVYAQGELYAVCGNGSKMLLKYNDLNYSWTRLADAPDLIGGAGNQIMAFDGDNTIYVLRGRATETVYKYFIDTNTWDTEATDIPGGTFTMGNSYGASIIYQSGSLYIFRGNNTDNFFKYEIGTTTWTALTGAPEYIYYGSGSVYDNGRIYVTSGSNNVSLYVYDITNNNWLRAPDYFTPIYAGGTIVRGGEHSLYVLPGNYSYSFRKYNLPSESTSYKYQGTYSRVFDLVDPFGFAGLEVTLASPSATAVSFATRTATDSAHWSAWSNASAEQIDGTTYRYSLNSTAKRYLEVEATLSSDESYASPTISDLSVLYYEDNLDPVNPTALEAFSSVSTASADLTSDTWYKHTSPRFDWPDPDIVGGATDGEGGSGIAGYYVYFGPNENAQATVSGTLITESEYTASDLESGEIYYLRIQAVDEAGHYDTAKWQPFIYKFDNTPPSNPVTITVNPANYTTVNDYTFTLKGATDSASLIKEYCYKYKTSSSAFSDEVCTSTMDEYYTATISGVLAYDNGDDNTFYVRARDNALNYATSYATNSYKYSLNAPGEPTNLRQTHPAGTDTNTVNEFSFAWDPPEPGSFNGTSDSLRYYYWIGDPPAEGTAENSVGMSTTTLSKGSYAVNSGVNRLYVVAMDESGRIDYDNYAELVFKSETSAPGKPRNIDISDVSIKETSAWRLALSWDQPESTGSGIAEYRIYRSAVTGASCPADPVSNGNFTYIANTTQTSFVDTGLTQSAKYYCVTGCNYTNGKGCGVSSDTVNLYPDGRWRVSPAMTASPSATIKTKSAVIAWSTNRTSNSFIKYGKSSGDYGEETGSSTQVTSHSVELTGLDPGTTYYYKALWTDEDGNSGLSDELTLTTNPAPAVSLVKTTNVSIYGVTVSFTIANSIKATVEYGKTLSYGGTQAISTAKNESTYIVSLTNLVEGTSYNYRIKAEDDEGNVYYSDNYTFETLPVPKITALKVQQVVGMPTATLRLLWTTNTSVTSVVTYYPNSHPERAKDYINLSLTKTHEAIIKDLADETEYSLAVTGKDLVGNQAEYPVQKVKTANDFRPPLIENFNTETTITGIGDEARAKLVITWDTDEPSTTQVEYGVGTGGSYAETSQEDKTLTSNHSVAITGLNPATIYHLHAVSKDKAENIAKSEDTVIITPKSTKGALELVVDNLSKSFGFLKGVTKK